MLKQRRKTYLKKALQVQETVEMRKQGPSAENNPDKREPSLQYHGSTFSGNQLGLTVRSLPINALQTRDSFYVTKTRGITRKEAMKVATTILEEQGKEVGS